MTEQQLPEQSYSAWLADQLLIAVDHGGAEPALTTEERRAALRYLTARRFLRRSMARSGNSGWFEYQVTSLGRVRVRQLAGRP